MKVCQLLLLFAFAGVVQSQTWEVGGAGGAGFSSSPSVTNAGGRAAAGIANTPAVGGVVAQSLGRRWSGEIRYTFRPSDLRLESGGTELTFQGNTHAVHYDMLYHTRDEASPARPFLAGGAGIRVFRGAGRESAYQPLQEFALLTKTREWKPLVSFGAGVKFALSSSLVLRVEARDYLTPFPSRVIAPAIGAKQGGWLHDIVPLVGLSYLFE